MASTRTHKWLKVLVGTLLLTLALGGGLFALNRRSAQKEQAALDKRKVKAERKDVRRELTLTGKVRPLSSVAVYSPVSGQVKEIFVAEGARVKLGQSLFSVIQDTSGQRELEALENDVGSARLELRVAEEALERRSAVKDLFSDGDNRKAQDEVQRRTLAAQSAQQKLGLLRERLGLKGQQPRSPKAGSVIFVKAPKDGVVTFISKAVGESVLATTENADATGREVLTLSDLERMIVRSRVLESDLAAVKISMGVKIKLDAYRNKDYLGKVSRISQQGVEDTSAGYTYFVTDVVFDHPDEDVRSQMNATIHLTVAEKRGVLTLPSVAVATLAGNSIVELSPEAGGAPRYRKVTVGLSTETLVEITDPAVKEGEEFLEIDFSRLDLSALAQGKLGDNDKVTTRRL